MYSGILAIKKKEILPFVTTKMDTEDIMLNEISHRERQMPYDFTYMQNLKNKINKTEINSQIQKKKLMIARWEGNREEE